jgi:hypothetical protein
MTVRYCVLVGMLAVMLVAVASGCSSKETAGATVNLPSFRMPPKEGDTFPKPPEK